MSDVKEAVNRIVEAKATLGYIMSCMRKDIEKLRNGNVNADTYRSRLIQARGKECDDACGLLSVIEENSRVEEFKRCQEEHRERFEEWENPDCLEAAAVYGPETGRYRAATIRAGRPNGDVEEPPRRAARI
jgi:hypothetical protein